MKKYVLILLLFTCCTGGFAYTRITLSSGETPKWSSMPVSYWINEKGLSQIANGSEFAAIQASFQTWENVQSANVRLVYRGTTPIGGVEHDGINVVTFSDTTAPLGSSTIAATFTFFKSEFGTDNVIRTVIDEADIAFNPSLAFSTNGDEGRFDIQSVLTHEIGHFLGLDHSGLVSSVMVPFGAPSQLDQRTLAYDDIAGITEIYPNPAAASAAGRIQGLVRSGSGPVFGAHVVAVNADGTPLVSTLSQRDGSYNVRFLPPGTYRLFAEPLDQPVTKENLGGGTNGFFALVRTDFGTTYFGNVAALSEAATVTVGAGGIATADILTLPRSETGLNLTRPAFAIRVPRGRSSSLTVGGDGIAAGVAITASSPALFLGTPTFGGRISSVASSSARVDLTVSSTAPLGPKNIAVNRGPDASVASGALVVTDTTPSNIAVSPTNGPVDGGTPVTITGANFRTGAQVFFDGLAASGINVLDSGTILANVPQNSPGAKNVVVVNSDGTWGLSPRAFTYDALPPIITRVTPLSGPPATVVVIEGENFDFHLQNVSVQFGGISARVVGATSTSITTIVPFGVNTGAITVSVFGKPMTGPVFTVTSATPSTNLAGGTFNFIDASASGGGTNLSFSNNDDAVAFATLPFNFSLFRDIYLAGSQISITTNGFLSLESLSVAEFQNGSLPGQTVARASGASGVIPPSLIAAFWDDLILKSGSTVTTRTVGDAPNRQFVVQWSNMSALDEDGKDQNSSLTFEAVLFEGSNDIQFLYRTMSGPRSDGSSSTIGAQDQKRTTAIQTAFNQPIISSGYFLSYRFENGAYRGLLPDNTAPTKPVVTDEGVLTASRIQLAASWLSEDPESSIREFQYAVGTTPGGTDVKPFTSTTQNSIVLTGLNLQSGTTYYFAVRAINGSGLVSETGVSDGIRYDAAYQPKIKIVPSAPASASEFTGIALLAPTAMSVILRAYDANGSLILGSGIRNPAMISLAAGQQYAKLLPELLGVQSFDGWIEVEASAPGLGIFTATGGWNLSTLDGSVAQDASADFVLFHAGASAIFVNPSSRTANVTLTSLSTSGTQSFSIPPRGRFVTTLTGPVRVQSSEALAALERVSAPGKLSLNAGVPVTDQAGMLVFPHFVVGGDYTSTLTLVNVGATTQTIWVGVSFSQGPFLVIEPNKSAQVSVGSLPQIRPGVVNVGALTVGQGGIVPQPPGIVGVLDIENGSGLVTMGARPAATEFAFPHVANGNGLFTGLAFATADTAANITIEVYEPTGGTPKSATISLGPNQQLGKLVSELVNGVATQVGGYIRVRSDQRIWAWEIYGSDQIMASGPPL